MKERTDDFNWSVPLDLTPVNTQTAPKSFTFGDT
jgi:hypothetical protein